MICCVLFQLKNVSAQTKSNVFPYCEKETALFCADDSKLQDLVSCLLKHDSELSSDCKKDIERFVTARSQADSRGALSSFGGLNALGPAIPLMSYEGRFSPGTDSTSVNENKGSISIPIYQNPKDAVSLSLSGGDLHLGHSLTHDSGNAISDDFYRIESGVLYSHRFENRRLFSFRGSFGYAGDKPFQDSGEKTYSALINYGFPGSGTDYWIVSLFESNNNPLLNVIPIPGFMYIHKTATFTGMFGLPITMMQWTPTTRWTYSISFFGPIIQSEIAYGNVKNIQAFTDFAWNRQNYIPSDRTNNDYRLTFEEKKATVGLRKILFESILSEIQFGYAFNRSIYIGKGFLNKDGGANDLASDWLASWTLKAKF